MVDEENKDNVIKKSHLQINDDTGGIDYKSHQDDQWNPADRRNRASLRQRQIAWRRSKVAEYNSLGFPGHEIAKILQVAESTVSEDKTWLRDQAKERILTFTEDQLPEIFDKTILGLTQIIRKAWLISAESKYERNKIMSLKLAQECITERMNLAANSDVIEKTAAFVARRRKVLDELQSSEWDETQTSDELPVPESANSPIAEDEPTSEETSIEVSRS